MTSYKEWAEGFEQAREEQEERRQMCLEDRVEAERRKKLVGRASPGSDEYYQNAAFVLQAYRRPNEETRRKLRWLKDQGYY